MMGKLASVCRAWHTLIQETPSMWAIISTLNPAKYIECAVRQSKNTSLTVDLISKNGAGPRALLLALPSLLHRIRSLTVWIDGVMDIPGLLSRPLPRLESLKLFRNQPVAIRPILPETIHKTSCPSLRHASLTGVWPVNGQEVFRGLSSLHLSELRSPEFTATVMAALLACSPNLGELEIRRVDITEVPHDAPVAKVNLPFLERLSLNECQPGSISMLLSLIGEPAPLCMLSVHCSTWRPQNQLSRDDGVIKELRERWGPSLRRTLSEHHRASVKIRDASDGLFIQGYRDQAKQYELGHTILSIPFRLEDDAASWLGDLLAPVQAVEMTIAAYSMGADPAFKVLESANVTDLTISSWSQTAALWNWLKEPVVVSKFQVRWRLPNLRNLIIESVFDKDTLLAMLVARYGKAGYKGETLKSNKRKKIKRPTPLNSLRFDGESYMDDDTFDDVCDILGDEVVDWDRPETEVEDPYDLYDHGFDDYEDEDFSISFYDLF